MLEGSQTPIDCYLEDLGDDRSTLRSRTENGRKAVRELNLGQRVGNTRFLSPLEAREALSELRRRKLNVVANRLH